jgi:hypothetical protein
MINRDRPRSGYWDHPKERITVEDGELLFARFFDFDQLACRDFRYLEVFIASSAREPDIVGRWALLTCSPFPDPGVMRVFEPLKGKEILDEFDDTEEASFAGAGDCASA